MTEVELIAMLADAAKEIVGDIRWTNDEDHSPAVEFRQELSSDQGYPIFVKGSFNADISTLTYALIHKADGRIYGLDLGKAHRNPDRTTVGRKHKHSWREPFRDRFAYEPSDITASASDPVAVWKQFCLEAKITHRGRLYKPRHLGQPKLPFSC